MKGEWKEVVGRVQRRLLDRAASRAKGEAIVTDGRLRNDYGDGRDPS